MFNIFWCKYRVYFRSPEVRSDPLFRRNANRNINSLGHNFYKLKKLSLEPVKIADYFKENNLFTLCLNIVSSRSNLQSLRI